MSTKVSSPTLWFTYFEFWSYPLENFNNTIFLADTAAELGMLLLTLDKSEIIGVNESLWAGFRKSYEFKTTEFFLFLFVPKDLTINKSP